MWRQRIVSVSNKVIDETPVNTKLTTQFVVFFELNIEYRKPWQASRTISVRTSALCRFLGTKKHKEECSCTSKSRSRCQKESIEGDICLQEMVALLEKNTI